MNTFKNSTLEIFKKRLRVKNYSERTILSYSSYVLQYVNKLKKESYSLTTKDLNDYLFNYKYTSISQQNQIINSLKLFYKYILNKADIHLNKIERPRKEKHLPQIIDKELIIEKLAKIENIKHRAILTLCYSVGMRVSELINLKICDIDSNRMLIKINNAKGKKDRIVPLSEKVLLLLRQYYKQYKPKEYLFNGQSELQYSIKSCQNIYKKYIDSDLSIHNLRHCCFTHLLENKTDILIIQKIAGHSNPKTTQIYAHISNNLLNQVQLPI